MDISGQRLALGRDKAGCFNILGFRLVDRQSQQQAEELIESLPTVPNPDFSSKAVHEVVQGEIYLVGKSLFRQLVSQLPVE